MGTGGNNVPIVLENHPQDSRVTIAEDSNVPTLTSRMGTGGAMCHSSSANHIADQKRMRGRR
jgi:DNA (cytosine-5)-methyltransferase 1